MHDSSIDSIPALSIVWRLYDAGEKEFCQLISRKHEKSGRGLTHLQPNEGGYVTLRIPKHQYLLTDPGFPWQFPGNDCAGALVSISRMDLDFFGSINQTICLPAAGPHMALNTSVTLTMTQALAGSFSFMPCTHVLICSKFSPSLQSVTDPLI